MKCSKVYCIKSSNFGGCNFIYGHIYNVSYDHYNIIIYDDDNGIFLFHKKSPFNLGMKKEYFTDLSEIRKQKLKNLQNKN